MPDLRTFKGQAAQLTRSLLVGESSIGTDSIVFHDRWYLTRQSVYDSSEVVWTMENIEELEAFAHRKRGAEERG